MGGSNQFQQLKGHLLNQPKPVYAPDSFRILQLALETILEVTPLHSPAHLHASWGRTLQTQVLPRATAEGAAVGWGPQEPPESPGQHCSLSGRTARLPGYQAGLGQGVLGGCRSTGARGASRTKAQLHGIAEGRQGPPLPQGADGRTQPQRRLLLLARRAAPPPPLLPIWFVHMDGEGLLPADQPPRHRHGAMALTAAPRRLWGERPVSAAGSPAGPRRDSPR